MATEKLRNSAPKPDRRQYKQPLFIAGGDSVATAIERLLEIDPACGTCLSDTAPAIATHNAGDPALPYLKGPLGNSGRLARVVTPPSRVRMLVPRPGELIFVDLTGRGSRLGKVAYAKSLFESEILYASVDLDRLRGADPEIAIGIWRPFVWNWARIGKHLGEEGAALTAELALGITARRYYLTGTIGAITVAVSTADPIVADLAGRAILQIKSGQRDDTTRGPWEAPVVQRSAELNLGVRTPDQIELSSAWAGTSGGDDEFRLFIERFADRLSITI